MHADDEADVPLTIPAQRGPRAVPTPRDVPARRRPRAVAGPPAVPAQRTPPAREQAPFALAPVPDAVGAVDPIRDRARSEVLHRHARLTNAGRPVFCTPSQAELAGVVALRQGRGTDGKVIYPTREAAEAAARELEGLGARALRSYLCGRSRSGHFHLATDTAHRPLTAAEVHARIPRQRGSLSA
jgi:hypothetical protein